MDHALFQSAFDELRDKVRLSSGAPFRSFQEGLPAEWESYKLPLRAHALSILQPGTWTPAAVGSGEILDRVIRAIEIEGKPLYNNLVSWQNRYGHASRAHRALLDATDHAEKRLAIERAMFEWFHGAATDEESFELLAELCGRRYDLLGYLFFLRDAERFMPVRPRFFDEAFERLGIDHTMEGRASWANYQGFNDALRDIQKALTSIADVPNVRLIDAHSFAWMLVKLEAPAEDAATNAKPAASAKTKKDPGRTLDARARSIVEMALAVESTVKGSTGPAVLTSPKLKLLGMTQQELREHIEALLDLQQNRCALTGIPLQYSGEVKDDQLRPSLDRKDSNGHYERGNLQVVCRFINFWKSSQDDTEFRRLLMLVRGNEE